MAPSEKEGLQLPVQVDGAGLVALWRVEGTSGRTDRGEEKKGYTD